MSIESIESTPAHPSHGSAVSPKNDHVIDDLEAMLTGRATQGSDASKHGEAHERPAARAPETPRGSQRAPGAQTIERGAPDPERYRERIVIPEARNVLEEHAERLQEKLQAFRAFLDTYRTRPNLTERDAVTIDMQTNLLAAALLFGTARTDGIRPPRHPRAETERLARDAAQEVYERNNHEFSPDDLANIALRNGHTLEEERASIRQSLENLKERAYRLRLHQNAPHMEASLYAIGLRDADATAFLQLQNEAHDIADHLMKYPDRRWTKEDLEWCRRCAYLEAVRTSRTVYTHVTNTDRLAEIFKNQGLKSSSLTSAGTSERDLERRGQTGNIEENIFMTADGGGFQYGTKIQYGVVPRSSQDFALFAALGSDILASGRSVETASPNLADRQESARGKAIGQFENPGGTTLPLEPLTVIVARSQEALTKVRMLRSHAYASLKDVSAHILTLPDEWIMQATQNGMVRDALIRETFKEHIEPLVRSTSPTNGHVYASIDGRESTDRVLDNAPHAGRPVLKWQRIY